jgi:hypothetical protein
MKVVGLCRENGRRLQPELLLKVADEESDRRYIIGMRENATIEGAYAVTTLD